MIHTSRAMKCADSSGVWKKNLLLIGTLEEFEDLHKQLSLFLGIRSGIDRAEILARDGSFTFHVTKESLDR